MLMEVIDIMGNKGAGPNGTLKVLELSTQNIRST